MSATLFLRKPRKGFSTRLEGYQKSYKIWTCRRCRAWHEHKRPGRCDVCGHPEFFHYDSAGEARWFVGLMRQLDHDELSELRHHPPYAIHVTGPTGVQKVFDYVADAEYVRKGKLVTADFKPRAKAGLDPVFALKRKCFEAEYGRRVLVVTEE